LKERNLQNIRERCAREIRESDACSQACLSLENPCNAYGTDLHRLFKGTQE
jgi:hypothetical protein